VVDTTGAGDAVMGVLAASLWKARWDPASLLPALPRALEVAARVTEARGALTGRPQSI
jgi:sugar/nucleoside kinase (ribokinase family)